MEDKRVDNRGSLGPQQVFSSDNDVLPEQGNRLRPVKIGCLAWLTYKVGCLLIWLVLILFVGLIAKFYGPHRQPLEKPKNSAPPSSDTMARIWE